MLNSWNQFTWRSNENCSRKVPKLLFQEPRRAVTVEFTAPEEKDVRRVGWKQGSVCMCVFVVFMNSPDQWLSAHFGIFLWRKSLKIKVYWPRARHLTSRTSQISFTNKPSLFVVKVQCHNRCTCVPFECNVSHCIGVTFTKRWQERFSCLPVSWNCYRPTSFLLSGFCMCFSSCFALRITP